MRPDKIDFKDMRVREAFREFILEKLESQHKTRNWLIAESTLAKDTIDRILAKNLNPHHSPSQSSRARIFLALESSYEEFKIYYQQQFANDQKGRRQSLPNVTQVLTACLTAICISVVILLDFDDSNDSVSIYDDNSRDNSLSDAGRRGQSGGIGSELNSVPTSRRNDLASSDTDLGVPFQSNHEARQLKERNSKSNVLSSDITESPHEDSAQNRAADTIDTDTASVVEKMSKTEIESSPNVNYSTKGYPFFDELDKGQFSVASNENNTNNTFYSGISPRKYYEKLLSTRPDTKNGQTELERKLSYFDTSFKEYVTSLQSIIYSLSELSRISAMYSNARINEAKERLANGDEAKAAEILQHNVESKAGTARSKSHYMLGTIAENNFQYALALIHYQKALDIYPSNARFLYRAGIVSRILGQYRESVQYFEKANQFIRFDQREGDSNSLHFAKFYNEWGRSVSALGDYRGASKLFELALFALSRYDIRLLNQKYVYTINKNISENMIVAGHVDEAINIIHASLSDFSDINQNTLTRENYETFARLWINLSSIHIKKARLTEAEKCLDNAREIIETLFDRETLHHSDVWSLQGQLWFEKGNYDKAIEYYNRSITYKKLIFNEYHPSIAIDMGKLAIAWQKQGYIDEANNLYKSLLTNDAATLAYDDSIMAKLLLNYGGLLMEEGKYDHAKGIVEKSKSLYMESISNGPKPIGTVHNNMGVLLFANNKLDSAIYQFKKALDWDLGQVGTNHPKVAIRLENLGFTYMSKMQYKQSEHYLHSALQIHLNSFGENHPKVAAIYSKLGTLMQYQGEFDQAYRFYYRALNIYNTDIKNHRVDAARLLNNIGTLSHTGSNFTEAMTWYRRAIALLSEPPINQDNSDLQIVSKNLQYSAKENTNAQPINKPIYEQLYYQNHYKKLRLVKESSDPDNLFSFIETRKYY